jgi:uncharacterized protein (TIGR02001 family)
MTRFLQLTSLALCFACASARASSDSAASNDLALHVTIASDYRFRGISQTDLKPAVQGGIDYSDAKIGDYAGLWFSNVRWIDDSGGDDDVECDLYAGLRGQLTALMVYDVGYLAYLYPANRLQPSANTAEAYGQIRIASLAIKLSDSLTNFFGDSNSVHSRYFEVGTDIPFDHEWSITLHAGRQSISNNTPLSFRDWKIGVNREILDMEYALAFVGTDTRHYTDPRSNSANLGKTSLILSITKTF